MLVYGDRSELADPLERLAALAARVERIGATCSGDDRHASLVAALIEAGQLLQGVADAQFDEAEEDRRTHAADRLSAFLLALARCVVGSVDGASPRPSPATPNVRDLPEEIELREPEGFAFYAVYPEAFIAAARRLRLSAPPRVIGIRSIGTTLGAIVSATLAAPFVTVRPHGDPFAREVSIGRQLERELLQSEAHYVVVDEGPGLSGSSFGAVADWLESRGVPLARIAFLTSRDGDLGPRASRPHRERWNRAQRIAAEFDPGFLANEFGPLREFSTGSPWERRKFLGSRGGEPVLLKFAGLGAIGERKLRMARALHAAGFTPEPLAMVHGFLAERWHDDARPLSAEDRPVEQIAVYVGARARLFPARESDGASLDRLLEMCRRNATLALGPEAASPLEHWRSRIGPLSRRLVRVRTDNRLGRGEWLRSAAGRLLKTDALDHHCAHDLIGCQGMAWDIAGAIAEFALNGDEAERLIAAAERASGRSVDRELLAFYRLAYACFRLGQATLAAEMCGAREALRESAVRHRADASRLLHLHDCRATPQDSLIG